MSKLLAVSGGLVGLLVFILCAVASASIFLPIFIIGLILGGLLALISKAKHA